ncbi:MAG TPA: serine protease [bacterium]|nr:serine protease [bacterium]
MKTREIILFIFLALMSIMGCSQKPSVFERTGDDIENKRLKSFEEIQRSILKVICSAYYENFYYSMPPPSNPKAELKELLLQKQMTTNSVSGTALVIFQSTTKELLLSCHHIFDFEDTVRVYHRDSLGNKTDHLQIMSIKYDQRIFVSHKDATRSLGRVLAFDKINDIALIETKAPNNPLLELPFKLSLRRRPELRFGQEVFMIGYPKGFLYIAKGLSSPSPYRNRYLISAPFNRGFSGGLVLAFEPNSADYFLAGMANAMAYDGQMVLTPDEKTPELEHYREIPYTDQIYTKELKMINYGLTFAIKGNVIAGFIKAEQERLKMQGFSLPESWFRD